MSNNSRYLVSYYIDDVFYETYFLPKDYSCPCVAGYNFIKDMQKRYDNFVYQFEVLANPCETSENRRGKILSSNM